jgi:hypothetical protein
MIKRKWARAYTAASEFRLIEWRLQDNLGQIKPDFGWTYDHHQKTTAALLLLQWAGLEAGLSVLMIIGI